MLSGFSQLAHLLTLRHLLLADKWKATLKRETKEKLCPTEPLTYLVKARPLIILNVLFQGFFSVPPHTIDYVWDQTKSRLRLRYVARLGRCVKYQKASLLTKD